MRVVIRLYFLSRVRNNLWIDLTDGLKNGKGCTLGAIKFKSKCHHVNNIKVFFFTNKKKIFSPRNTVSAL